MNFSFSGIFISHRKAVISVTRPVLSRIQWLRKNYKLFRAAALGVPLSKVPETEKE